MDKNQTIKIFHLYRKDGTTLFLHPFSTIEKFLNIIKSKKVLGKYGREPRVESLTLFRNDLYRLIESAVRSWVSEIRFIPKFLISTVLFLLTYVFCAVVIRDPIPILDEIAISFGVGVLTYFLLGRRDKNSNIALKKRVELRTKVDQIIFEEDVFVKKVEDILHRNETAGTEKIIDSLLKVSEDSLNRQYEDDVKQLIIYLEKRFDGKVLKKQEKMIRNLKSAEEKNKGIQHFKKWAADKKIDLSLFATYAEIKKTALK